MRIAILLFFGTTFGFSPLTGLSQEVIHFKSTQTLTVDAIFEKIEAQTPYHFIYRSDLFKDAPKVQVKKGKVRVSKLLKNSLNNLPFDFEVAGNTIVLIPIPFTYNIEDQQQEITGTVTDENGVPLAGVNVQVEGTTRGTFTDFDGNYELLVENGDRLIFSFVGFEDQVVSVDSSTVINVSMKSGSQLDEAVVVAYGEATRESITGSISSIDGSDLKNRSLTNVGQVLEGAAPGIQVNLSGQPGDSPTIRIRGFTTMNGSNAPLIVLDGVTFGGSLSDINPSDIESISVLKDASATALYGNRASNGVILIDTKSAMGDSGMEISIKQGFSERGIEEYDRIGPDEFMESMMQGYKNSLLYENPNMTEAQAISIASSSIVDNYLFTNIYNVSDEELFTLFGKLNPEASILPGYVDDLDWFAPSQRRGYRQEYSMNARTNSEKGGVYFSLGYLNDEGYLKHTSFDRLNASINATYSPTDWLKTGVDLKGTYQTENSRAISGSTSIGNPIYFARTIAPIYAVHEHDENGDFILDDDGNRIYNRGFENRNQFEGRNPIEELLLNRYKMYRNTLKSQVFADINFLKNFTFSIKADMNLINIERQRYDNELVGAGQPYGGRGIRTKNRNKYYTFQQTLNWKKNFGQHNFEFLAGHENYYSNQVHLSGEKREETFSGQSYLNNFNEIIDLTDYESKYTTEGYFGRLRYNFNRKYYLEGSFRRDGSSKFSREKRWGNFWSIGGNWQISKERFMSELEFVDNLKLRASYGEVGNDNGINNYAYQGLYQISQNNNLPATWESQFAAPDLRWETSSSYDVALEMRLFDRFNLGIEYFDKRSQNLLFDKNLPLSVGSTSLASAETIQTLNFGTIANFGVETHFDIDLFKNDKFRWNIGANATFMKNRIKSLPDENKEKGVISGNHRRIEGGSIYDWYHVKFVGVDQLTGDILYELDEEKFPEGEGVPEEFLSEINGKFYSTKTNYAKREFEGTAIPDVYGSFSTLFEWNNFTLSGLVTYQLGGKTYDNNYRNYMRLQGEPKALHRDILKSWKRPPIGMAEDDPNRIAPNGVPALNFSRGLDYAAGSTRWLKNSSYLVIKNIRLGYSFPKGIIDNLGLNSLYLNLGVENLATFTSLKGMNPQDSFSGTNNNSLVTPRIFSFGINVGL